MKDLHIENSKTLSEEIQENTNKWKDIPVSWNGKITILPKAVQLNKIPIKIPRTFFTKNSKIYMEPKQMLNSQRNTD